MVAGCGNPRGGNLGNGAGVIAVIIAKGARTGAYSLINSATSSNPSVSETSKKETK